MKLITDIRDVLKTLLVLGNERFQQEMEALDRPEPGMPPVWAPATEIRPCASLVFTLTLFIFILVQE